MSTDPDLPDSMDEGFLSCREDCSADDVDTPSVGSASSSSGSRLTSSTTTTTTATTSPTSGVALETSSASSFNDDVGDILGAVDLPTMTVDDEADDDGAGPKEKHAKNNDDDNVEESERIGDEDSVEEWEDADDGKGVEREMASGAEKASTATDEGRGKTEGGVNEAVRHDAAPGETTPLASGAATELVPVSSVASESTPPSTASIGDDFLVFRKAQKRSFVKASSESSSAEMRPKKTSNGIVDYSSSSSSSSSSSTSSLDSDDDSDGENRREDDDDASSVRRSAGPPSRELIDADLAAVETLTARNPEGGRGGSGNARSRIRPPLRSISGRRIRRRPVVINDDSDDDDDEDEDSARSGAREEEGEERTREDEEEDSEKKKEEDDEEEGQLPVGPKPNWFCLNSLREREYGGRGWAGKRCAGSGYKKGTTDSGGSGDVYNCYSKKRSSLEFRSDFICRTSAALCWVQRFDLTCRLDEHQGCVNSLHFNESGSKLSTGSDDLNVIIWDWAKAASASRRRKVEPIRVGASRQRRMWMRGDGSAASSSSTNAILAKYESGHRSNVFQTKFLPFTNDGVIVSCARDGQVRVADIASDGAAPHGTRKLALHKGSAHKLSTMSDSSHVVLSCGEDAAVKSVDLRADDSDTDILVTREGSCRVPLYSINANPLNPNQFITSGRDPWVRFYDRRMLSSFHDDDDSGSPSKNNQGSPVKKFCPHNLVPPEKPTASAATPPQKKMEACRQKATVTCAVFSNDGSQILASYNDDDIYLFDAAHSDGADYVKRYQGHRNNRTIKGVNFYGPRSEYVVSGSDCGHVFIWDKESEQIVQFLPGDEGGVVNCLEPHPSLPYLATSGLDHDIKLWSPIKDDSGPDFSSLLKTMKQNGKERESESGDGAVMDGHMLWFLMQHLRRRRRRRMRRQEDAEDADEQAENDPNDPNDSEDESTEEDEEEEGDEDVGRVVDCNPS